MDLLFRIEPIQSEDTSRTDSPSQDASNQNLPLDKRFIFSPLGGLIGRSPECDWVLTDPDRRLSGKHAAISYENHQYCITDLSTNGLFVNEHREPLGKGSSYSIESGDRFTMGPFCIVARLSDSSNMPDENDGIKSSTVEISAPSEASLAEHEHLIGTNEMSLDDILEFPAPLQDEHDATLLSESTNRIPKEVCYRDNAPDVVPPPNIETTFSSNALPSVGDNENLALLQFLRGAGVNEDLLLHSDISELMFNFGALLKCYTGEIMKLMGERSRYKNQCRLDMTLVAAEHNNPLKYCVNEAQALREIIISPQPENLSGGRAVESAMDDIRDHFSRVEKGYQGTLSSLINFLGMTNGKDEHSGVTPDNIQPTPLSNRPWHYRRRLKQLQQKTAMLKESKYYSDEFFSPRFAYFYQNPDRVCHHPDTEMSEAEKGGGSNG